MWYKLPVNDRMSLMKTYKKGGFSYNDMVKDYNDSYQKFGDGGEFSDYKQEKPMMAEEGADVYEQEYLTGMMKARMATSAHFGNPSAQRMTSPYPKTGQTPFGVGTHYMASMSNYAVPLLQDKGGDELMYNENPKPSNEDIRFESSDDAEYFSMNYKSVAPMMRNFEKK